MLGGRFAHAPHGAICAALLPYVFETNAQCLQQQVAMTSAVAAAAGGSGSVADNLLADPKRLGAMVSIPTLNRVRNISSVENECCNRCFFPVC